MKIDTSAHLTSRKNSTSYNVCLIYGGSTNNCVLLLGCVHGVGTRTPNRQIRNKCMLLKRINLRPRVLKGWAITFGIRFHCHLLSTYPLNNVI